MPRIVIDETRCKGCGLCTVPCPRNLIALSDRINRQGFMPATISPENLEKCTSCAMCARVCPDVAIAVYRPVKTA